MLKIDYWIGFCKAMIPPVMNGDKTNSRRVIVPQPHLYTTTTSRIEWLRWEKGNKLIDARTPWAFDFLKKNCPYGKPGDILGVKEGYQITTHLGLTRIIAGHYLADDEPFEIELSVSEWARFAARKFPYRATPGRFMYRSLCRTRLLNKGVRVERVQDITERDAEAEGIHPYSSIDGRYTFGARGQFIELWNSINAKRGHGWDVNPWVRVVEFERIDDELG